MKTFKIATWNVNSLRVRLPHVLSWLEDNKPDVLCLQETKLPDSDFPATEIEQAGYSVQFSGQRTYNGMAVLSKKAGSDIITDIPGLEDAQRRLLAVTIDNIRILNLYIPNGESVESDKFKYKLNWLKHLDAYLKTELKKHANVLVVGDFNIAPHDIDVHDPKSWEGHVLFSEQERNAFQEMLNLGFKDCFREQHPTEKVFSWWDYRMNAFKRNLGLRIDHILASEKLYSHCVNAHIDKQPRTLERPSDHTPVIAEFKISE